MGGAYSVVVAATHTIATRVSTFRISRASRSRSESGGDGSTTSQYGDATKPGAPGAARRQKPFSTVSGVLCSKFVIMQVVFNAITSVVMSLLLFWLLFALASEGPYEWWHPNFIGVWIGSVMVVTPTSVMGLAPAGMPEALDKGWFFLVKKEDLYWPWTAMPFLVDTKLMKFGLVRCVCLGATLFAPFFFIPLILTGTVMANGDGVNAPRAPPTPLPAYARAVRALLPCQACAERARRGR